MSILTDRDLEQMYDDMLDECYEPINICGYEYSPSIALVRVDPIAYDVGFADYISSLMGESLWELPDGTYTDEEPEEEAG